MTTNEFNVATSEIDSVAQHSNEKSLDSSYGSPQKSQSQPPLQQIIHDDDNNDNNEQKIDSTYSAYNYAASTISGAYSYMTSFYPQSVPPAMDKETTLSLKSPPNASKSLSAIKPQLKNNNDDHGKVKNGMDKNVVLDFNFSKPDPINYPMSNITIESDIKSVLERVASNGIDNEWTKSLDQPKADTVKLRSSTYKFDGKKECGQHAVFRLVHVQAFKTDLVIDHVAMHPVSWFNQNMSLDDLSCFTLIVHLQVQSIKTSFISYHVLDATQCGYNSNGTPIIDGDPSFTKLLDLVLNCNDSHILDQRLKLIPRVVSGPYPVKRVVENRPVLLGNKVRQKYFRGSNYFEIDSKVDDSMVAASIIKLCHRFAKRIVVDMAWTIQGEDASELPERLLCGVTIHNMDFSKCKDIKHEIQNCHKLKYNDKKSQKTQEEQKQT